MESNITELIADINKFGKIQITLIHHYGNKVTTQRYNLYGVKAQEKSKSLNFGEKLEGFYITKNDKIVKNSSDEKRATYSIYRDDLCIAQFYLY
jgi:hypothetical protein